MARILDITDKLSFEENPVLVIKGKKLEINADVSTVLKIMGMMSGDQSIDNINTAYELLFSEKTRKDIEKLGIKTMDWITIVKEAISLIMGDETQGEQ